jgi:hypothetical protein
MECCGKERRTRFCSECGEPLDDPLASLLKHVTKHAKHQRDLCESAESLLDHPPNDAWRERRLERMQRVAAKWESWQSALEKVVEESSDG